MRNLMCNKKINNVVKMDKYKSNGNDDGAPREWNLLMIYFKTFNFSNCSSKIGRKN